MDSSPARVLPSAAEVLSLALMTIDRDVFLFAMFGFLYQLLALMGPVVLFVLTGSPWWLCLFPVMLVAFFRGIG